MNCSCVAGTESLFLRGLQRKSLQLALHCIAAHSHGQNDFASLPIPWKTHGFPWRMLEIWRLPKMGAPQKMDGLANSHENMDDLGVPGYLETTISTIYKWWVFDIDKW